MPNPPEHKLRWYQYKLSSLFILTTLVALACSWYAVQMDNAAKRRAAIAEIEKLGGIVCYYDASDADRGGKPPAWYSWLRKLHGDEHLGNAVLVVFRVLPAADSALVHLKGLTKLEVLVAFGDTQITDAGLVNLQGLTKLKSLNLEGDQITDVGLVNLEGLTNLERLYFQSTQVTGKGVKKLQEALPNCKILHNPPHG